MTRVFGSYRPGSPSPHVVIINDYAHVNGGQAKVAIESALGLRARGFRVSYVAGVTPIDPRLVAAGIECVCVGDSDILSDQNRLRAAGRGIWNRQAAKQLQEHLAGLDPSRTVAHLHGWAKALSPSVGPILTRSAVPHLYTLHEYFLACPNGGFYDHRRAEICTRRPLGADCLMTNCDPRHAAHKIWRTARQATLWSLGQMPGGLKEIIYLLPRQQEIMAPFMPAAARWHHLPNPVDPRPMQRVRAEESKTFLFIGRLSPEKGALVAAHAARKADVEIAFAGDGEQMEAVRAANPEARMLGWLSNDAVAAQLAQARALVFPSLWYECYPLVIADALRLGVPIIISDSSIATGLVGDRVSGLHVPGGDVDALAAAMRRLLDDTTVRKMSLAAYAAGGELLDLEDHVDRLVEIYDDVAAASRSHLHLQAGAEG